MEWPTRGVDCPIYEVDKVNNLDNEIIEHLASWVEITI